MTTAQSHRFRVALSWSGRVEPLSEVAQRLHLYLTTLEGLHPALGGWRFEDPRAKELVRVEGPAACRRALEVSTTAWYAAGKRREAQRPRFFVGAPREPSAELALSSGVGPLPLGPIYAPDRLDLCLFAPDDDGAGALVIENALRAAVVLFRPDFAHAGTEHWPRAPEPLISDGAPAVGWLTFLSAAYPRLEPAPAKPARAEPLAHLGVLYTAHSEPAEPGDAKQRAAVERLAEALRAAKLLVPPPSVAPH